MTKVCSLVWDELVLESYEFWVGMALRWLSIGDQARFNRACNRAVSWLTGGCDNAS